MEDDHRIINSLKEDVGQERMLLEAAKNSLCQKKIFVGSISSRNMTNEYMDGVLKLSGVTPRTQFRITDKCQDGLVETIEVWDGSEGMKLLRPERCHKNSWVKLTTGNKIGTIEWFEP